MNEHHEDMKDLAEHVDYNAEFVDMDDATRNQYQTASSNAMRAIFDSHDKHEAGNTQAAHAGLLVAGRHIDTAAKLLDRANGSPVDFGMTMTPKQTAELITNSYKYGFRS